MLLQRDRMFVFVIFLNASATESPFFFFFLGWRHQALIFFNTSLATICHFKEKTFYNSINSQWIKSDFSTFLINMSHYKQSFTPMLFHADFELTLFVSLYPFQYTLIVLQWMIISVHVISLNKWRNENQALFSVSNGFFLSLIPHNFFSMGCKQHFLLTLNIAKNLKCESYFNKYDGSGYVPGYALLLPPSI